MSTVFISYRRDDSAAICGRLYDRLIGFFGRDAIFKDVDSIPLGTDFEQYIGSFIQRSAAQLVLIGPRWLSIPDASGGRRLDDPHDVVRLEVEMALRRGIAVIPVLVLGAAMPSAEQLPPGLRPLAALPPVQMRLDPDFDGDVWQLAQILGRWIPPIGTARPAQPQWGGVPGYAPMPQQGYAAVPSVLPSYAPSAPPPVVPGALAADAARRRKRRFWPVVAVALAAVVVATGVGAVYFVRQASRTPYFASAVLNSLAATGDGTVWAVGTGTIARYDNLGWAQISSPTKANLLSVAMARDGGSGWAVGTGGTIIGYAHGVWSLYPQVLTTAILYSVSLLPDGSAGWAVGNNDVILRYQNGRWDLLPGAVNDTILVSVSALSPTDAWLAADDGSLMHYNGTTWQNVPPVSTEVATVDRVQMFSPTDGWATGYGTIWHYDGAGWHDVGAPVSNKDEMFGVAMTSPTDGWAVGWGVIMHDSGGTWSVYSQQYQYEQLRDIVLTSATEGWIVADRDILHLSGGAWTTAIKSQ